MQSAWGDFTYTYGTNVGRIGAGVLPDKTVEVTPPNDVSGAVKIPATVTGWGHYFTPVTSIGDWVFWL